MRELESLFDWYWLKQDQLLPTGGEGHIVGLQ